MSLTVSVIIISYNSSKTIEECLVSLNEQTFRDFEVILLDNNSTDNTKMIIESLQHQLNYTIKTFYLSENLGFAGGNNFALSCISSNTKYIGLINPDAKADKYWLQTLIKEMDNNSDIGISASKLLTYDGSDIDSAGDIMLTTFRGFKREAKGRLSYMNSEYIFGACGGAALYRRTMIDQIGFFDQDFFIQCEDTDLNFRAQLAGWKVLYVPNAIVYHRVSHSIGKASDTGVYYSQRNMEFVRIKNVPILLLLIYLPQIIIGHIIDFLYFGLIHKKWKLFIKSKIDAIKMIPVMLKKRKKNMIYIKKVNNTYIRSILTPAFSTNLIIYKLKKIIE